MNVHKYAEFMGLVENKNPQCESVIRVCLRHWLGCKVPTKNQQRKILKWVGEYARGNKSNTENLQKLCIRLNATKENFDPVWDNWYKACVTQIHLPFLE